MAHHWCWAVDHFSQRQCRHIELPTRTNHSTYCNFINGMLCFNYYWLIILSY